MESGSLFEVGGGWIGKRNFFLISILNVLKKKTILCIYFIVRWQKSTGAVVTKKSSTDPSDLIMTPEDGKKNYKISA